jgi:phosphoinositide-3-kinase regulatory subunit 4
MCDFFLCAFSLEGKNCGTALETPKSIKMGNTSSRQSQQPFLPLLPGSIEYEHSLGSGRFIKTIRASQSKRRIVCKIFVKPVPPSAQSTVTIASVLSSLRTQNSQLSLCLNCFLNWNVFETERAVVLVRPYFLHNLYDRM